MTVGGAIAIIPARLDSSRFPGKVLARETGKPLVQHVWERVRIASGVARVVVASDDQRVLDAALDFGAEAILTRPDHPNGSSRIAEACTNLNLLESDIIVNVQADEPEIEPAVIEAALEAIRESDAHVSTVASPFHDEEDPADPNIVKVVIRLDGTALYFTRARVPFHRDAQNTPKAVVPLKHVGMYCYRAEVLQQYARLPESPLERTEKLEQLRFLEHGYRIAVAVCRTEHHGIDTPEQYAEFVTRYREHAGV